AGIVTPDEGAILLDGEEVRLGSPARAAALGIALVHQELAPLDNLDVAGNVFLGREPRRFGLLNRGQMLIETRRTLDRLGSSIAADAPMADLSLAERQTVEIAKALAQGARVLILDEPTSSLTHGETEALLRLLRELRAEGVGIVYVSHRLGEVREISDRAVALRDGRNAGELAREAITAEAMVRLMVGRDIHRSDRVAGPVDAPVRLRLDGVRTRRYPNEAVTLEVRAGEVLGIAGLVGAGRSELLDTIFGTERRLDGTVSLDGQPLPGGNPKRSIEAGIGLVPEDRRRTGLLVEWPIGQNITLPTLSRFSKRGLIPRAEEGRLATKEAQAIGVKAPNVDVAAATLSGGNQQKVVLAKWLLAGPKALLLDEPTRGVDVRSLHP
ncbi:sugar ABC transporter ATP-binding protein, partial [bacterium]